MGVSDSRCDYRCRQIRDRNFTSKLQGILSGLKDLDLLTIPMFKDMFLNILSQIPCELYLVKNRYKEINTISIAPGAILFRELMLSDVEKTFTPIPKIKNLINELPYGIIKNTNVLPETRCIFIKITFDDNTRVSYDTLISTITKHISNLDYYTHIVFGWDNFVSAKFINYIMKSFRKKKYIYSNAICNIERKNLMSAYDLEDENG